MFQEFEKMQRWVNVVLATVTEDSERKLEEHRSTGALNGLLRKELADNIDGLFTRFWL